MAWSAIVCFLLLPLAAGGELFGPHQPEAVSCGMTDCHCDCCPVSGAAFSGCRGCSAFLSYLAPGGLMVPDLQVFPHRHAQIAPVTRAFIADIFHPPKFASSLI